MNARPSPLRDKVLQVCSGPDGATVEQAMVALGQSKNHAHVTLSNFALAGHLTVGYVIGLVKHYFATPQAARAWEQRFVDQARAACAGPQGATSIELRERLGLPKNTFYKRIDAYVAAGHLFVVFGAHEHRWFADADAPKAAQRGEAVCRVRALMREHGVTAADIVGLDALPAAPKVAAPAAPPRPSKRAKEGRRGRELVIKPAAPPSPVVIKQPRKDAPVIVPPHVQVQVCPSGRDTRFTFDPPPGWKGAITQDWLAERRRMLEARREQLQGKRQ